MKTRKSQYLVNCTSDHRNWILKTLNTKYPPKPAKTHPRNPGQGAWRAWLLPAVEIGFQPVHRTLTLHVGFIQTSVKMKGSTWGLKNSITDCCSFLSIVVLCCPLLSIVVNYGPLLSIIVHCCPLLSIVVHCYPVFSIVIRCCPVHCCPMFSIVVHCYPFLSNVVHCCYPLQIS